MTATLTSPPPVQERPKRSFGRLAVGLVRTARPRQWLKNGLVITAPFAAGKLLDIHILASAMIAFVSFCITASGVYFINDARDVALDRAHPKKRFRPIAAGDVPVPLAYPLGAGLLALGGAIGWFFGTPSLTVVLVVYAAISIAYCFFLKDEPVIDLVVIASGFLLRAMAGGFATDVPLSDWFLLVASFGSLFVAAGKRYSEAVSLGEGEAKTRPSLARYSISYLRFVWGLAAAVTVSGYALWAFEMRHDNGNIWPALSIAPFVLSLLRYAIDVDSGKAGSPEDVVLQDRTLLALGVIWVALLTAGVAS
jgi:decaprenyl-phosphate phosphoribosyltransferase